MRSGDLSWLVDELRALAGDLDGDAVQAPLVLAIDQGGHASRVVVFDVLGTPVAESFAPISTFRSGSDRVEHDPEELIESIRTALGDVHQALGDQAHRVIAAGLATQRSSIACWDSRDGKALAPVLSWQDRRNAALVEKLRARQDEIRRQTGLVLSPHYGASKLRWCLDNVPAVRAASEASRLSAGPLAAFLLYALLDERPRCVDPANASRTQLWDPRTLDWSPTLAESFGVPLDILPRCVPSRHMYGHLPFGARRIPLIVCTGDQSATPFATGSFDGDTLYLNVGTGAFLQRSLSGADADAALLRSVIWSDGRQHLSVMEATVNGAGSAIDWLNERIGIDTHRATLAMKRATNEGVPPLFINGIAGVGSPYWIANLQSRFSDPASEVLQVQAVVESIAFLICLNIERMPARRVLASGGLAASDYLCECIAALSGLPVERTTLREATAMGLAFLVAAQPAQWQPPARIERFMPERDVELQSRFARWREVLREESG